MAKYVAIMKFEMTHAGVAPLTHAKLIKRYKRFLADATLDDGTEIVAHCANSGSMMGLKDEGASIYLSPNTNPKAKLDWRWEMIEVDGALVGINTSRPNAIVAEAISAQEISELCGYDNLKREVKYGGNSRIDILLSNEGPNQNDEQLCYVEVKSVTLKRGDNAEFPDAVTARGTKHLNELIDMVKNGHRAVMFYLVQRGDCGAFNIADDIDPLYAKTLVKAKNAGVELLCYDCELTTKEININKPLDIML
ncbi:MAG: DNA/RNA nuclease SfsA [Sphingomonadales bacterium]|nr:DNA/RNA nuclease SfsA [Sphingomonadales bacterium]